MTELSSSRSSLDIAAERLERIARFRERAVEGGDERRQSGHGRAGRTTPLDFGGALA
jgi:hypothetical protein